MNKQKELWEKLAKANSRYYIYSSKGKQISEVDFVKSGSDDYNELILKDKLIEPYFLGKFLEIGCGIGRMTEFISIIFSKVTGIDISGEMINQAKERLSNLRNVTFVETDGENLPFEDNSFDIVFSYLVFQHIKSKKMIENNFKEIYRVLKPNGLFKVLLRTDHPKSDDWWTGIGYNEKEATILAHNFGFYIEKQLKVKDYAIWLWLKKYENNNIGNN